MSTPQEFDGGMIYCMKTILSYYEIKKDRILSDYLYLLCIPLMVFIDSHSFLLKEYLIYIKDSLWRCSAYA